MVLALLDFWTCFHLCILPIETAGCMLPSICMHVMALEPLKFYEKLSSYLNFG